MELHCINIQKNLGNWNFDFSKYLLIEALFKINLGHTEFFVCFVWFDSLRPINNLSVIKRRVFLGWTSTKLGLMFLLKDTTQWRRWDSNPRPFGLESSTLPLSHHAPSHIEIYAKKKDIYFWGLYNFMSTSL